MKIYQGKPVFNRLIVFFISLFIGWMGFDRIYLGDYQLGILKFITLGFFGIWYFIDVFRIGLGEKIGNGNYYWLCEIDKKSNCQDESQMIFKCVAYFVLVMIIIYFFYGPKEEGSIYLKKDEIKDDKFNYEADLLW